MSDDAAKRKTFKVPDGGAKEPQGRPLFFFSDLDATRRSRSATTNTATRFTGREAS
jgi:hypothetical protein